MQRFYLPSLSFLDNALLLEDKDIIFQLVKVLRIRVGEEVIFFDGKTNIDYLFLVKEIDKKSILFSFKAKIEKVVDKKVKLHLYQAIPNKLSKIEYIIQKGVEVGINSFIFFSSNRSQKLILSDKKILRLNKIIIEAVEQSNQNIIPKLEIKQNISLEKLILSNNKEFAENLFFHTSEENTKKLKDINTFSNKDINIFVGPEGGWSKEEISRIEKLGYTKVCLGNNILRTETVGIVVGFFLMEK
ncbi:hypothetical protein CSB08_00050 [Candidatus Gracilibacteria bacterium]|nr:MAG: hypothetical protein CSB08_00050 [Candidatus Gracilibacteria bacterium]PIE85701.1 MAG: hypothetical protein CSA08_00690 [Candidatus Gracilibacteria bacterium]